MTRSTIAVLLLCTAAAATAQPTAAQARQPCPVARPGSLVVYGDVPAPITLTEAELMALPQVSVEGTAHGAEPAVYSGPTLESVLAGADLPRGRELRGAEVTRYIVVEAADGYRALFALPELDSMFRSGTPILALRRNGVALDAEAGPWQVIVPGEQRHARWVRQVSCLRIGRDQ